MSAVAESGSEKANRQYFTRSGANEKAGDSRSEEELSNKDGTDTHKSKALPEAVITGFSSRYTALKAQVDVARKEFDLQVAEKPALKEVLYAKAATLSDVIECMVWAQALQDPNWQPIASEVLKHSYRWEREKLQKHTTVLNIDADFAAANSDADFKRLVFSSETKFQEAYQELVSEIQVSDAFETTTRTLSSADFFMRMMATYMKTEGYYWSDSKKTFSRAL